MPIICGKIKFSQAAWTYFTSRALETNIKSGIPWFYILNCDWQWWLVFRRSRFWSISCHSQCHTVKTGQNSSLYVGNEASGHFISENGKFVYLLGSIIKSTLHHRTKTKTKAEPKTLFGSLLQVKCKWSKPWVSTRRLEHESDNGIIILSPYRNNYHSLFLPVHHKQIIICKFDCQIQVCIFII